MFARPVKAILADGSAELKTNLTAYRLCVALPGAVRHTVEVWLNDDMRVVRRRVNVPRPPQL